MKTRELIRQLQAADPGGELECCVDNHDILFVERQFAFYDGALEILVRDPGLQGQYDVVGGIIQRAGEKIRLHILSLEDALSEAQNGPFSVNIEGADDETRARLEQQIDIWRKSARGK